MVLQGYLQYFDPLTNFANVPPDLAWLPLTLIATFTVVIVYSAILAIARAFSFQELERFSKAEILNAGATALIAIFLVGMLGEVQGMTQTYFFAGNSFDCGGTTIAINQFTDSLDLLQCRLTEKANDFSNIQQQVTSAAAVPLNLLNMYIGIIGVPIYQGNYNSGWFQQAEEYRLINTTLTNLLIGLNALIISIDYVKKTMLSFWLPLGVFLRALVYTRSIGAFLMSMAIGLFFIYPLVYIMTDPAYIKPAFTAPVNPASSANQLCFPTFTGTVQQLTTPAQSGGAAEGAQALSVDELEANIATIYTAVLIQPFVALAITMMFVRFMMYILGGEPQDLMRGLARVV